MKSRFDARTRPLAANQSTTSGPEVAAKANKTEAVKPTNVLANAELPVTSQLPSQPNLIVRAMRTLGAGAAAALMATSVGFAQGPNELNRSTRVRLAGDTGANLTVQRGAELRLYDNDPRAVMVSKAYSEIGTRLRSFATTRPGMFGRVLDQVYGDRLSPQARAGLLRDATNGEFPFPAETQFLPAAQMGGADAAYDAAGQRIFVSEALLKQPERLKAVLLEEIGHHIDRLQGPGDAVGDEGHLLRTAVEQGRTLSQLELQAGRLDRDQGQVSVNGAKVPVEFSTRAEDRAYEVAGSFTQADIDKGVSARFESQVQAEVIATAAAQDPAITTLEQAQAHFGEGFEAAKAAASKALVSDDEPAFMKALGDALIKEAVTSSVVVRLKVGEVLPEETTLDTRLSPMTQVRVDRDPVLSKLDPKVETWGALVQALAGDVDADGKIDFDALTLQRFLPDAEAQEILRAIQKPLTGAEMREKLGAVGFKSPMLDGFSIMSALDLTPPKLFGLTGRTKIDKTQQQLLLRTGRVFVDSNEDGKINDGDAVHFVDRDGTIKESTYGDLPSDLKKLVKLNIATATVAEEYASLGAHQRMKFPHYDAATGKPGEERVNADFWTISSADANNGQTSWELKVDRPVRTLVDVQTLLKGRGEEYKKVRAAKEEAMKAAGQDTSRAAVDVALIQDYRADTVKGHRPSEALNDLFNGNGAAYTTECAHGRTLIRLQGLQNYYKQAFGEGAGAYKFDMLFAASRGDKAKAAEYVKGFEAAKAADGDTTWADYTKANPMPEVAYGMEVSRHRVFGANESVVEPFKRSRAGSAAGDTGYFHNYSVSVEGVKIGYVGENVIDLGYKDGTRRYWGHPGGMQTESKWQGELASRRITVHGMGEFAQYFSHTDTKRGSARVTSMRIKELDRKIHDLRIDQPAGYEAQIKQAEGAKGWWTALDVTRKGLVDHLDRGQLDAADKLFSGAVSLRDADDAQVIYDLLTAEGRTKIAGAFDGLDEDTKAQAVAHFGVADAAALNENQKANTVLFTTLTQRGQMHSYLRGEAQGIVTTERFLADKDLLTGDGHLASKAKFSAWIQTDDFGAWYKEKAGRDWEHGTDLAKLTVDQVKAVVELALPMVKGKRTIYADVNRGSQMLSKQMATLLKEGKLPKAEYQVDSMAVAPLE